MQVILVLMYCLKVAHFYVQFPGDSRLWALSNLGACCRIRAQQCQIKEQFDSLLIKANRPHGAHKLQPFVVADHVSACIMCILWACSLFQLHRLICVCVYYFVMCVMYIGVSGHTFHTMCLTATCAIVYYVCYVHLTPCRQSVYQIVCTYE